MVAIGNGSIARVSGRGDHISFGGPVSEIDRPATFATKWEILVRFFDRLFANRASHLCAEELTSRNLARHDERLRRLDVNQARRWKSYPTALGFVGWQ